MLNILRIFATDAKRIFTNVVALVVFMGLTVIPCLYAWFNIFSNWDPYGPEATGQLPVAVYSDDRGASIDTLEINVGDTVIENLKANDSINWQFTESSSDAIEGVKRGTYYACLIINEGFSNDLISFLGGSPEHPTITYYENEKKNAIAPKITATVRATVQSKVNSAFVGTLADSIMKAGSLSLSIDRKNDFFGSVTERLNTLDSDLSTIVAILNSYISLIETTDSLMNAVSAVTAEMDTVIAAGNDALSSAQAASEAASNSAAIAGDMVTGTLRSAVKDLRVIASRVSSLPSDIRIAGTAAANTLANIRIALTAAQSGISESISSTQAVTASDYSAQLSSVNDDFSALYRDIDAALSASNDAVNDSRAALLFLSNDLDKTVNDIEFLADRYDKSVDPQMKRMLSSVRTSLDEAEDLLSFTGNSINSVVSILGSYPDMMGMGTEALTASRDEVLDMKNKLEILIGKLNGAKENEQYQTFLTLLQNDPEVISDFITSPVDVDSRPIYAIETNGSATAPFYIILSIWVGALILVAIVHTKAVDPTGVSTMKTWQEYFGRYMLFFMIGQLQTILTALGAVFFVGIQIKEGFLFVLACLFTSFTFTLINYSLTYAFGAVGEAVSIVLMVIQVAGSGGTFPVEVLPKIYQDFYAFMPFAHGMNAVRECIGGMHGADYWIYLSRLLLWVAISLFIGLVLSIPMKKLNEKIEHSKDRTDLMA